MARIVCFIFILFQFSYCFGQKGSAIDLRDSLSIEQVVISASRAISSEPLTFQNITKKDIEHINLGQDPVILLQELSPSILTYSDGGTDIGNYSQLRLRGVDQSRINITLNGVPLNDMVDHGVFFSNFSDFGNSVESIQIIRGAGASHRGVATYGGAINFESTQVFANISSAEVQMTIGSFGTLRTAAEIITGLLENNTGFYGRFTRTKTDGYKYNSGSDSYSMFFSGGKLFEKDMFKLTAFSGKTQNGQSYLYVPLQNILDDPRSNFNDHNDIDDFEQHMVQVQYARISSDKLNYHFTVYYNGANGVFPFSFGGDQFMFGLTNDHYGLMLNFENHISWGKISGGIHAYLFDRENFEYITPLVTTPYTRDFTDKSEVTAFLEYNNSVNILNWYGNLELRSLRMEMKGDKSLGVSLQNNNSWTFFNGVVGANVNLNKKSILYLSLARANREPTRSDIINGVDMAESVTDLEIGWKYKSPSLRLNINGFFMSFSDEISNVGALQERSYIQIRRNVDKSRRSGLEAQMTYNSNTRVSATLNAAYMNTNINSDLNASGELKDVSHVFSPDLIIQPSVNYKLSEKFTFRVSGRYVSESYSELSNNSDFSIPSHFIVNANMNVTLAKNLSLSFLVGNVFDQLYYTDGGPVDLDFDGLVESVGYRVQPLRHYYFMAAYKL